MKKKNGNTTDSAAAKSTQKNKPVTPANTGGTSVTDRVKAKAGRGSSNEGTNVSYEEER